MRKCIVSVLTTGLLVSVSFGQSPEPAGSGQGNTRCSTCHECAVPTKSNPCLKQCPRGDNITVHHSPAEAPDIIILDHAGIGSDLYSSVSFSHRLHAEMATMSGGCASCHHYNPPGSVLACRECHEIGSKRLDLSKAGLKGAYHRQCAGCHRTWGNNVDCNGCHRPVGSSPTPQSTIASAHSATSLPERLVFQSAYDDAPVVTFYHNEHVNLFGIECATCHTGERCERCHSRQKPETVTSRLGEDAHNRCGQCHEYDKDCTMCHDTKIKPPFDHAKRTGFALASYHARNHCQRCHGSGGEFGGLSSTCKSCHGEWNVGSFDHSRTGFELDEVHREFECEVCHSDDSFSSEPVCTACHDDVTFPKAYPGRRVRKN